MQKLEPIKIDVGQYACPLASCSKVFKTSSRVRRHLLIHTGDKPYVCNLCGYQCNQSTHLKIHLQNQHNLKHEHLQHTH